MHSNLTKRTARGIEAMSERKIATPPGKEPEPLASLRRALRRCKKAELVDVLMELAQGDYAALRRLTARVDASMTAEGLVAATRQAIGDATAFNKRDMNQNFAYDHTSYSEVKGNLSRLIGRGKLRQAMELGLELMTRGSHQVEMSDEGLMREEIEECLGVVIEALGQCDLSGAEVVAWCTAMLERDRVGFIASAALESLRDRSRRSAGG